MRAVLFGMAMSLAAVSVASADVNVTMQDGRVSVIAKDATVRQILTEWARVGQTKIVNVDRVPGGPVTLELQNVPEAQALEILLRSLSGYITAPRAVEAANLSRFDRIIIMPTVAAARPPVSASAPPPVFQQPQYVQPPSVADDEPEDKATPAMPVPPGRGPVFNSFPQPQVVNPQTGAPVPAQFPGQTPPNNQAPTQPTNSAVPTAPYGGVAVPGMVVQPPPQPGQAQPGQVAPPQQPGQPRRPGGQI
jgi:hypothetical protein